MHLPHWIVVDSGMLATAGVGRPSSSGEPSHLQREVQTGLWSPGLWSDSGAGPSGHVVPRGTSMQCGSPRPLFLPLVLIPCKRWVSSNTVRCAREPRGSWAADQGLGSSGTICPARCRSQLCSALHPCPKRPLSSRPTMGFGHICVFKNVPVSVFMCWSGIF